MSLVVKYLLFSATITKPGPVSFKMGDWALSANLAWNLSSIVSPSYTYSKVRGAAGSRSQPVGYSSGSGTGSMF